MQAQVRQDSTMTSHGLMKRQHYQPVVAFWRGRVRGHQHVCPLNCHAQLRFEVEKGFHVNSSWTLRFLSPVTVMESEVFLVRICVNTQMRLSLSFLCQFPVL